MLAKGNKDVSGWAKEASSEFPELRDFIMFLELSGLRREEGLNAYNLIIGRSSGYYNEETSYLEHFRLPKLFIRPTKNAFVTVFPKEFLLSIAENQRLTNAIINKKLQRRGFCGAHGQLSCKGV